MSQIKSLLFVCAAVLAVHVPLASAAVTYGVGACGVLGLTASYLTITEALAATPAPDVVELCPGTYREQLEITRPVTLEGVPAAVNGAIKDQAIIAVPTGGLKTNVSADGGVAAQIFVNNVNGPVNITNIVVDGEGNKVSSEQIGLAGVLYLNSSGTVNQLEARYQSGNGQGFGVWVEADSTQPSVTVENSNVHNFDGAGISIVGTSEMTANVEGNTVVGGAPMSGEAGLHLNAPAAIALSGNFIKGGFIGIYADGSPTGSISSNTITDSFTGIQINSGQVSVTSNKLYNISEEGIVLDFGASVPVQGNTITQADVGINFNCVVDNDVTSNTISVIHGYGLFFVPHGVTSTNTYFNVPTVSLGGC